MKAEELMIGDWVSWKEKPVQIATISGVVFSFGHIDVELAHCGSGIIERHDLKSISPIPLTSEILEKNGFENDFYETENIADYTYVRNEGYTLRYTDGFDDALVTWCNGHVEVTTDFFGCVQKDISFVHQLQHALRFCGIERDIVLQ